MSNLFSVFDPTSFMGLALNWTAIFMVVVLFPVSFWTQESQLKKSVASVSLFVQKEFKAIMGNSFFSGATLLSCALFFVIWVNNVLGLTPYVFTGTSHLSVTLALAFPIWSGTLALSATKSPGHNLAHLVPLGSPAMLSPFMVIIEFTSNIIRPLTLAVRLAANMVAGHLLMVLLSTPIVSSPVGVAATALMALIMLSILETAVATIQAYVFSTLTVLYVNDTATPDLL